MLAFRKAQICPWTWAWAFLSDHSSELNLIWTFWTSYNSDFKHFFNISPDWYCFRLLITQLIPGTLRLVTFTINRSQGDTTKVLLDICSTKWVSKSKNLSLVKLPPKSKNRLAPIALHYYSFFQAPPHASFMPRPYSDCNNKPHMA